MSKVFASITISVDGYVTGPDDGPGKGLGEGGERLHYWVFGGPWSYDEAPTGKPGPVEQEWFDSVVGRMGAAVAGRNMYEAAGHWGDTNPWGVPCFIVTHRAEDLGGVAVTPRDSPCRVSVPPQCPRIVDSSRFGPFPTNNEVCGEPHTAERQCSTNILL